VVVLEAFSLLVLRLGVVGPVDTDAMFLGKTLVGVKLLKMLCLFLQAHTLLLLVLAVLVPQL
jgi:hypothetical protein